MTALVDVTFLLLTFFMATASFTLQQCLPLPAADDVAGEVNAKQSPAEIVVVVDEYNTFSVITSAGEVEAPSVQELFQHLREAAVQPHATQLRVRASREATHQRVVSALDAATKTGIEQIRLETIDEA